MVMMLFASLPRLKEEWLVVIMVLAHVGPRPLASAISRPLV